MNKQKHERRNFLLTTIIYIALICISNSGNCFPVASQSINIAYDVELSSYPTCENPPTMPNGYPATGLVLSTIGDALNRASPAGGNFSILVPVGQDNNNPALFNFAVLFFDSTYGWGTINYVAYNYYGINCQAYTPDNNTYFASISGGTPYDPIADANNTDSVALQVLSDVRQNKMLGNPNSTCPMACDGNPINSGTGTSFRLKQILLVPLIPV